MGLMKYSKYQARVVGNKKLKASNNKGKNKNTQKDKKSKKHKKDESTKTKFHHSSRWWEKVYEETNRPPYSSSCKE